MSKAERAGARSAPRETAVLFTDIVGSTRLSARFGSAMTRAQSRHFEILRQAARLHGADVFKLVGDQACIDCLAADAAVAVAIDGQRRLQEEDWSRFHPDFPALRVRMAIHLGDVEDVDDELNGVVLAQVSRLLEGTDGGQILISDAAVEVSTPPEGGRFHHWGAFEIRDFERAVGLYQIVSDSIEHVSNRPRFRERIDLDDRIVVMRPDRAARRTKPVRPMAEMLALCAAALREDGKRLEIEQHEWEAASVHRPETEEQYLAARVLDNLSLTQTIDERLVQMRLQRPLAATPWIWQEDDERFTDLSTLLEEVQEPVVLVLGEPGSGKSTLLRRIETAACIRRLREPRAPLPFRVQLSAMPLPGRPGAGAFDPAAWLADRWDRRHGAIRPFREFLAEGGVLLLLDGLNEMPHESDEQYRSLIGGWRRFLAESVGPSDVHRAVIACRNFDYSAPLSSPSLRVSIARIESLDNKRIRDYVSDRFPSHADRVWQEISTADGLRASLRTPFFLSILLRSMPDEGGLPAGQAAVLAGFVRHAMRREIESSHSVFEDTDLVPASDSRFLYARRALGGSTLLPDQGPLFGALGRLAEEMLREGGDSESPYGAISERHALRLIDHPLADKVLRAGVSLGILEEDGGAGGFRFSHQLFQEFFAAREQSRRPEPRLAAQPWRLGDMDPDVDTARSALSPGERLPPLPASMWEVCFGLAVEMTEHAEPMLSGLARYNLPLAARCASAIRPSQHRWADERLGSRLLERMRSPDADPRARWEAGHALGEFLHPEYRESEDGAFLLPPLVRLQSEVRTEVRPPIDAMQEDGTSSATRLRVACYAVTNAEWRCFLQDGGYEDPTWWPDEAARLWRAGVGTGFALRQRERRRREAYRRDPDKMRALVDSLSIPKAALDRVRRAASMADEDFEAWLRAQYPDEVLRRPEYWAHTVYASPWQPVVGISWFEASAYTLWLSARSGLRVRLPSEEEWEAAATTPAGARYPWGSRDLGVHANTGAARFGAPSPVGVFPEDRSRAGIFDIAGNTADWTLSAWWDASADGYPALGGSERPSSEEDLSSVVKRVFRGGSWAGRPERCAIEFRDTDYPGVRGNMLGMRLVVED